MTKIGSSRIETGTYFAARARIGAMMMVGRSIRDMMDAMSNFVPILFSSEFSSRDSCGRVLRAKFAPRTTRISGTATPPDCPMARVTELAMNDPSSKKSCCNLGMEATTTAMSMAHRGGFMNSHSPPRKREATAWIFESVL